MLISASKCVAFAHFPKTAGTSLREFLMQQIPDMRPILPEGDVHMGVKEGTGLLRQRFALTSRLTARVRSLLTGMPREALPHPDRIYVLGVVREPFEMAISLFEYWNRVLRVGHSSLSNAALRGDFISFLSILAEDSSHFPTYRQFYHEGGPYWQRTVLVDFDHLHDGLNQAFDIMGIRVDMAKLPRRNTAVRVADGIRRREEEAGELAERVRSRYSWPWDARLLGGS